MSNNFPGSRFCHSSNKSLACPLANRQALKEPIDVPTTPSIFIFEAGIDGVLHFTGREESGNTEITAEFKTKTLLTEEELETAKQVVDDVYAKVV